MSVILQLVVGDPSYYFGPFFTALGRELGAPLGAAFGNFLHQIWAVGAGGNGGNAGFLGAFLR